MFELPRGLWRWLSDNAKDMARIASALEKMVDELARIRAELEAEDRKEDQ